jgi:hypothetical protein
VNWLDRTHGRQFELARHFFTSVFENEMFSSEHGLRLAASAVGLAISAGMLLMDPRIVDAPPEKLRVIAAADELSLLTFLFAITGVLAVLAWNSLFPSRGDYLALASLPIKPQQIFGARFCSVALMATVVAIALAVWPSVVSRHNYGTQGDSYSVLFADIFARALSTSLGCLFVFFAVVAIHGLVTNLFPGRWGARVTPYLQGGLLIFFVMAGLYSFVIQGWQQNVLQQLSDRGRWAPPVWFSNLHNLIMGGWEPTVVPMAIRGLEALGLVVLFSAATYLLALLRYQQLLVENRDTSVHTRSWRWNPIELIIGNPRQQAIIEFIWKVFGRSRMHRVVLLAHFCAGVAVMTGTVLVAYTTKTWPGWRHMLPAAISSVPIGVSFVMLTGVRYSFLLPVQLRANWIFQLTESQGRDQWLSALEHFVILFVIFPVHFLPFLVAVPVLGWRIATCTVILQVLVSCCMFELLFNEWQQVPFACSYVPAKSQLATVIAWWVFVLGFLVPILGKIILATSRMSLGYVISVGIVVALWRWLHTLRQDGWGETNLVYEDRDDVVPNLGIAEAAYAITRYCESDLVQRSSESGQTIDVQTAVRQTRTDNSSILRH